MSTKPKEISLTLSPSLTEHASALFTLSTTQIIVILGIIVFGMAAFITTYNAITSIETDVGQQLNTPQIQHELWVQFGWTLGLSLLILVVAGILAFIFKSNPKILVLGLGGLGIFGIIYSFLVRFQYATNVNGTWENIKLYISWALFIMFIILAIVLTVSGSQHLKIE